MNNLVLKGQTIVCGAVVPYIAGGFGKDKKAMLVNDIAKLHCKEVKHINEKINDNKERFKDGIDILDLKEKKFEEFVVALTDHNYFTNMQTAKANNIFILSERGYAKLIKIMDDELSWEIYDRILDEYFEMKEGTYELKTKIQFLQEFNKSLKAIDQLKRIATNSERRSVFKQAMNELGFELPEEDEVNVLVEHAAALKRPIDTDVEGFIKEQCVFMPGQFVTKKNMHNAYINWCKDRDITPLSINMFGKHMFLSGTFSSRVRIGNKTYAAWVGIALSYL